MSTQPEALVARYAVDVEVQVYVTVNDPSAIARCVENHDDQGVPQEDVRGGSGWRNVYYPLKDARDVVEHWTYNLVTNGISDVSRLDGWADLEPGAVTLTVEDVYVPDSRQIEAGEQRG